MKAIEKLNLKSGRELVTRPPIYNLVKSSGKSIHKLSIIRKLKKASKDKALAQVAKHNFALMDATVPLPELKSS